MIGMNEDVQTDSSQPNSQMQCLLRSAHIDNHAVMK